LIDELLAMGTSDQVVFAPRIDQEVPPALYPTA
jgi:hypothetical protein